MQHNQQNPNESLTSPESVSVSNSEYSSIESVFPFNIQVNNTHEIGDDPQEEDRKLYYISTELKETKDSSSANGGLCKSPLVIFQITKENGSLPELTNRKRNRGREPRNPTQENSENPKQQTRKFERDDILTKNQVHYFSYIILFLNRLLEKFEIKKNFKQIDYAYKKKVNYDYLMELREKKLYDIVSLPITGKFKKQDKEYNMILCKEIKELNNPVINAFFELNYLYFFRNYYYKSEKLIYLKNLGSKNNYFISLSDNYEDKIITYQDKINSFQDKKYAEAYTKCIEELYLSKIWKIND